ncbi:MAG: ABC transporter permease [Gammaproteobacteria bacterium]|nr:MAG: ABC transporter permease [Gammaproteobacteria bacterium]
MLNFLFKRILQAGMVMFVISFIAFAVQSKLGDPVAEMVAITASAQEKAAMRQQLGLNDPFMVQYGRFLKNAVQGDLGTSYFFKRPTTEVILQKLPATLELVFAASLIIIVVSIPLGVYTAIKPNSILSKSIMGLSIVGISVPVFLTAIVLINIFSLKWHWLPSFGRGDTTAPFGWDSGLFNWDGISHLILPAVALSSIMLPLFIRLVRSEMLEALSAEYIRFAYAKGLPERKIWYKHALKNTMLPVITVGGVQLGMMVAYTILTETVFQWPGVGFMFLEAVNRADIPLLTTYIIFVGLIFVTTNTLIDLLYGLIDPTVNLVRGKR